MKKSGFALIIIAMLLTLILSACAPAAPAEPAAPAAGPQSGTGEKWKFDYIAQVPPIMMREPLIEMLGPSNEPYPL